MSLNIHGYSMPNAVYHMVSLLSVCSVGYHHQILFINIYCVYVLLANSMLVTLFLNELQLICSHTVQLIEVLLFNNDNSIKY